MERTPLLPLPEGLWIEQIQLTPTGLTLTVIATHPTSCCPLCSQWSSSVHSHYQRTVGDVPCGGRQVQLVLCVRRFYCRNPVCQRKVFTERLPTFVESWARMTIRLCQELQAIGLATCGKSGARLAARLGMPTSRQTILRRIMEVPSPAPPPVRDLGIDEFAFRSGGWFGTILVDLERHRVIDLLPDRQADTAEQWMRQHPTIRAVSRDRGGEYAKAARLGAPQAVQIADRFHIVKNLTEATQRLLERCQAELLAASQTEAPAGREPTTAIHSLQEWRPLEPAQVKRVRLARRAGRLARYEQVVALHAQGMSTKEIAQRLGLSDRTVQHWQAAGTFPEARRRRKRRSAFDAFAPEVLTRWQAGERNGQALWQAIKAQGYRGSERTVYRYLEPLKQAEVRAAIDPPRLQRFSAKTAVWLFVRDPTTLDAFEQEDLAAWCQASRPLKQAYRLVQDFLVMVHQREGQRLDARARAGDKQCTSRTPVLCLWGGARQGGSASGLNFSHQ
jgi:transposase